MPIKSTLPLTFGGRCEDDFSVSRQSCRGEEENFCENHSHSCFEIVYVKSGRRLVTVAGEDFVLTAGMLAVIPPYVWHATLDRGADEPESIVFGYADTLISSA